MRHPTTSLIPDQKVINQFLKGDKKAFDQIYEQYAPALFGVICRLIADKKSAEQVLQQSFVTIWHQKAGYKATGSFFDWSIGIVKKIVLSFTEIEEKNTQLKNQTSSNTVYVHAEHPSELMPVADKKTHFLQDKALQLMYLCGKSPQEVARYLNITPEQVARDVRCAINRKSKQLL